MIFHYTKALWLQSILAHGLKPSGIGLHPGEKPLLWFTTNERWENTVFISTSPTLQEAHEYMLPLGGLARIVCDDAVAPYRWKEMKEVASVPSMVAKYLYDSAIRVGSRPGEWRGTLDVVPVEQFRAIEVYDGERWVPVSEPLLKAA
jgi:hypothetical protein